jgi:hypothetical protein
VHEDDRSAEPAAERVHCEADQCQGERAASDPLRVVVMTDENPVVAVSAVEHRPTASASHEATAAAEARCTTHNCLDAQVPCRIVVAFGERG